MTTDNTGRKGVNAVEAVFLDMGKVFRHQPVSDFGADSHAEIVEDGQSMKLAPFCSLLLIVFAISNVANAAGFDCAKAMQPVELAICGNSDLSQLDEQMAVAFKTVLDGSGESRTDLLTSQRQWLRERNRSCNFDGGLSQAPDLLRAGKCLEAAYRARITELSTWTPAKSNGACQAVRDQVLRTEAPASTNGWQQSIVLSLDSSPTAVLKVDRQGAFKGIEAEILAKLRNKFRATPKLIDAVKTMIDGNNQYVWIYRAGQSDLHAVELVAGTASCQSFVFFDASHGGQSQLIVAPPVVKSGDGTSFCRGAQGWLGEVGGIPAFVVEGGLDNKVEIGITPWLDKKWQSECGLSVVFGTEFKVTDKFCKGLDCEEISERAKRLAIQYNEIPVATAALSEVHDQPAEYTRMKQLAEKEGWNVQMPTFGETAQSSFTGFDPETALAPVEVGGQTYLARISHASFGWRESPDYIFAAYRLVNDKLDPVAGIYIVKNRAKVTDASVKSAAEQK